MSRNTTNYAIRLLVLVVSMVFIGADLGVSAQNANSSTTTMPESTMMQNSNASNTNVNRGGRRRRGRRRSGSNMGMQNSNSACGPMQDNTSMNGSGQENANTGNATGSMNTTPAPTGRCDPNAQEQTDLSGTYTGTANYTEGGLSGETTLTISGNDFTMTSGSATQEGRVVAVTTCGYTGVTMMFGKPQVTAPSGAQPAPVPIVSLRARKVGGGLTLESVGGETRQFSFNSAPASGGGGRVRPRKRSVHRMESPNPVSIKPPTR